MKEEGVCIILKKKKFIILIYTYTKNSNIVYYSYYSILLWYIFLYNFCKVRYILFRYILFIVRYILFRYIFSSFDTFFSMFLFSVFDISLSILGMKYFDRFELHLKWYTNETSIETIVYFRWHFRTKWIAEKFSMNDYSRQIVRIVTVTSNDLYRRVSFMPKSDRFVLPTGVKNIDESYLKTCSLLFVRRRGFQSKSEYDRRFQCS